MIHLPAVNVHVSARACAYVQQCVSDAYMNAERHFGFPEVNIEQRDLGAMNNARHA
jgi:hypothetical protein